MTLGALCWMMAGCADEVIDRNGGKGEGRLLLAGIDVESVVSDVLTKASLAEDAIPAASDFTITIVSAATGETVKTLQPGVEAGCFLPVGEYRVKAAYGEEAGMSAVPYFYGESDKVTIVEGEVKSVSLTASLASAVIRPQIADKLVEQYNFYTLTVSETGGSGATPSRTLASGEDFFVSGGKGKTYNLILAGQNKLGETVTHTWSYSDLVRRTRYIVQCDPDLPAFTLPAQPEGNVWSKFIYITPMTTKDISYKPTGLTDDEILRNVKYEASSDGINWVEAVQEADKWIVKGLTPSSTYKLRSNFFDVYSSNPIEVTTEAAAPVPNGDFEELRETISETINQGGRWSIVTAVFLKWFQTTLSMKISEPTNWASVNQKTYNSASSNQNSWYMIPSTFNTSLSWLSHQPEAKAMGIGQSPYDSTADIYKDLPAANGNNAMVIRNVAWDLNGLSIADNKQTGNTDFSNYFCNKTPSSINNRSAGKLFLGSYSYNSGSEMYNEGIAFTSRPINLKGYYRYVNDNQDTTEKGTVTVQVLNGATIIASGKIELSAASEYTEFSLPLVYSSYDLKATDLHIMISSSNHTNEADIKTTNYVNKEECCSRGAMLTIDNLTFSYEQ